MAKKVGRKRSSTKRITEEQREFNNLYNKIKYHYKKIGRWGEFSNVFTRTTLKKNIELAKQVNKGVAMQSITPEMLLTARFRKIHDIQAQEKKSHIKNALKLFYDLSNMGDEIEVGGNQTKVKHLKVDGVDYVLQNGKIRIVKMLEKHVIPEPVFAETEADDMSQGFDEYGDDFEDDYDIDFGDGDYPDNEEWEYEDEDDEIGYPKDGV